MNTLESIGLVYTNIINFTLILARIFTLFYTFSVFRREMVTVRIILSLSVMLSLYVLLLNHPPGINEEILSFPYLLRIIVQMMIGFCAGIILNIAIEIFTSLGQILSTQIGLSTASLFDPRFGMITSLTHFYVITAIIIFFQMNGHLIMIKAILDSFTTIPVDFLFDDFKGMLIFKYASVIFSGAVLVSITVIAAIMMTNLCLAMMSKFAPQFNLFSIGLNMSLLIGLLCVYLTYQIIIDRGELFIKDAITVYQSYLVNLVKK